MSNVLLEKYSKKIQLAESVYAKAHNGERMGQMQKMTVAKCLDNVNKFLTESLDAGNVTQRSSMGEYKKFCLALTNVGIPNLIAFDLVAVSPMSSISGNVAYMEYIKGTTRQGGTDGDLTNGVYKLGDVDPTYTASVITERFEATAGQTEFTCALEPKDTASVIRAAVNGVAVPVASVSGAKITITPAATLKVGDLVTFAYRTATMEDLAQVPVETLPTLKAKLTNIALEAKPRRIAIYYSQLAAFQAKTDYGFNLSEGLAEQAVGQLSYEIDSEIVNMLHKASKADANITNFSKTQPVGVSLADHYAAFAAKIEEYKMAIYD